MNHFSKNEEIDYGKNSLGPKQMLLAVLESVALCAAVAFLFYRSTWALAMGAVLIPVYIRRKGKKQSTTRRKKLEQQFKSGMLSVSGALAAGYSLENAWKTAEAELVRMYGSEADFCREIARMNQQVRMNEPLEQQLYAFACRSGSEDICNFAEIFRYAKRSGGNMNDIIRTTVERIQEKSDILGEIENLVAAKKMEQNMMNLMFPGILLFVTLTSPEYVKILYHNWTGVLIMTGCLIGYLISVLWSEKITNIQV